MYCASERADGWMCCQPCDNRWPRQPLHAVVRRGGTVEGRHRWTTLTITAPESCRVEYEPGLGAIRKGDTDRNPAWGCGT